MSRHSASAGSPSRVLRRLEECRLPAHADGLLWLHPEIGQTEIILAGRSEDVRIASTRLVRSFNVLGLPALSMPCGFSASGLPIGLQIVGAPFREARILKLAAAIEDSLGWRGMLQ